jgi:hypothetical protein
MKQIPLLLFVAFGLSLCNLTSRLKKAVGSNSNSGTSSSSSNGSTSTGDPVTRPSPTAAQIAALAGGQTATWEQQGISWTMPASWHKESGSDSKTFSLGGGNTAFLTGNISSYVASFPADAALKAAYDQAKGRQQLGEVDEVHWLELDGLKGVQFREAKPEKADDIRRLQWQAYRQHAGQTQLVNLILSARGNEFTKHEDQLYGILYSTKLGH